MRISASVSERFHAAIGEAAHEEGISVADYVRASIAEALRRSGHLARLYPEAAAVLPSARPRARYRRPSVLP